MNRRIVIVLLMMAFCAGWTGCTPKRVREARQVLTEADSLRLKGIFMTSPEDSLRIAQTVETLHPWRLVYAADYAKACFHYGRTLRAKGHYPEAMQCFLNAIHSHSRDYEILGRVYSNIGDLYQDIESYSTAFSIYQKSSNLFLQARDTIAYCYALNNMAWQKIAMLNPDLNLPYSFDTIEIQTQVRLLLDSLAWLCKDEYVERYRLESIATLHYFMQQYDSAQFVIDSLYAKGDSSLYIQTLKARNFSKCDNDSASYYAWRVLSMTNNLAYQASMYYILSHDTLHYNINDILHFSSKRADAQKIIEEERGNKTKATELYAHKTRQFSIQRHILRWVIILGIIIAICAICLVEYRKRQQKLLSQIKKNIQDKELEYNDLINLHEDLYKSTTILQMDMLRQLEDECEILRNLTNEQLIGTLHWNNYNEMCSIVDQQFYLLTSKLQQKCFLNETELRLCILVLVNLSRTRIAEIIPYSLNGIGKLKDHTAKKFGTTGRNMCLVLK